MINLNSLLTTYSIYREGDNPIFGESVTRVIIDDDAAGPFIIINQVNDDIQPGEVKLELEELELVYKMAKKMLKDYPNDE